MNGTYRILLKYSSFDDMNFMNLLLKYSHHLQRYVYKEYRKLLPRYAIFRLTLLCWITGHRQL